MNMLDKTGISTILRRVIGTPPLRVRQGKRLIVVVKESLTDDQRAILLAQFGLCTEYLRGARGSLVYRFQPKTEPKPSRIGVVPPQQFQMPKHLLPRVPAGVSPKLRR